MPCRPSDLVRMVLVSMLMCIISRSQGANVLATFKSRTQGFALQYPRSWYPQIVSDLFSIVNFPPSSAIRGEGLAEHGAGIHVLSSSQAIRDPQKVLRNLDELVAIVTLHQKIVGKRTLDLRDGDRTLRVLETKSTCCNPTQESIDWYFQIDGHMFVATLYYWEGEPKLDSLRKTLKNIVLSLKVVPRSG